MVYFVISSVALGFALYNFLCMACCIPSIKISNNISKHSKNFVKKIDENKKHFQFVYTLSKPLSKYVSLSIAKQLKLASVLDNKETPEQYVARLAFTFVLVFTLGIPLGFISLWMLLIPLGVAVLAIVVINAETKDKSVKLQQAIDDEIPKFIEIFSHSIKTDRNVINIFDTYTKNFDTYFSREVAKTAEDMRTGSQEVALQRFELRMNNKLLSQLIRGILATMRGEDMSVYFDELVVKMSAVRKQRLTAMALKIKPKISLLSNLRALLSVIILIFVVVIGIASQYWR